jgi:hypothetical protein
MKWLFIVVAFIAAINVFIFNSWKTYEIVGYILFTAYLVWNIYAYFNGKTMQPPMNYKIDFSASGDKSARLFLLIACAVLFLMIQIGWALTF